MPRQKKTGDAPLVSAHTLKDSQTPASPVGEAGTSAPTSPIVLPEKMVSRYKATLTPQAVEFLSQYAESFCQKSLALAILGLDEKWLDEQKSIRAFQIALDEIGDFVRGTIHAQAVNNALTGADAKMLRDLFKDQTETAIDRVEELVLEWE